ncbi:uncharacterized protein J3D65DRAFT_454326 [Phyllosticta citribraziliensis]|uniref:Uncharacterized protein n=1 Tax=Phyllosticta citribraziliensis TaxID=989973 RepID=A0ABR1LEU6_9PEZI
MLVHPCPLFLAHIGLHELDGISGHARNLRVRFDFATMPHVGEFHDDRTAVFFVLVWGLKNGSCRPHLELVHQWMRGPRSAERRTAPLRDADFGLTRFLRLGQPMEYWLQVPVARCGQWMSDFGYPVRMRTPRYAPVDSCSRAAKGRWYARIISDLTLVTPPPCLEVVLMACPRAGCGCSGGGFQSDQVAWSQDQPSNVAVICANGGDSACRHAPGPSARPSPNATEASMRLSGTDLLHPRTQAVCHAERLPGTLTGTAATAVLISQLFRSLGYQLFMGASRSPSLRPSCQVRMLSFPFIRLLAVGPRR